MEHSPEMRIYRSRQPIPIEGGVAYLDFWDKDRDAVVSEATRAPGRLFEELSWDDIQSMPPKARFRALAAWANAFGG